MYWQEIEVTGVVSRSAIEHCAVTPGAHVELMLPDDSQLPQAVPMYGMWFVELSITGFEPTADSHQIDGPDDRATGMCFTGTISGTGINVRVIYFGEVLDHFYVERDE